MLQSRTRWLTGCLILFSLICSGCQEENPSGGGSSESESKPVRVLKAEELTQAVKLHNQSLAQLENKEWLEADATLSELIQLIPESESAHRNLAICRTLAIIDRTTPYKRFEKAAEYANAVKAAETTITALGQFKGSVEDAAIADLLMGQLMVFDDSPERPRTIEGLKRLTSAAERMKTRGDFWMAIAAVMETDRTYTDSPELIRVLKKCFELEPDNLYVLERLVEKQASGLESENPETRRESQSLTDTLTRAIPMLEPMNASFIKQTGRDMVGQIRTSLEQSSADNLEPLSLPAMQMKNLLLRELAKQIDMRMINRNLLDYARLTLDSWIEKQVVDSGLKETTLLPPVLTAMKPDSFLETLTGITDVAIDDFNLDGVDDVLLARDGRIEVYQVSPDGRWELAVTSPAVTSQAGGSADGLVRIEHFLVADLDRDFDKLLADINRPYVLLDFDGDTKIVSDPVQKSRWFDSDLDVIGWSSDGLVVLHNVLLPEGVRQLQPVPTTVTARGINDVVVGDIDADGDLDLVLGTNDGLQIWKCLNPQAFELVPIAGSDQPSRVAQLAAVDWNRDMALDVMGVSESTGSGHLQNLLHGRFRWQAAPQEDSSGPSSTLSIADFDQNDSWDRIQAGRSGIHVVLTNHGSSGNVLTQSVKEISKKSSRILSVEDFDNDGKQDVIAVQSGGLLFLRGRGDGSFEEQPEVFPKNLLNDLTEDELNATRAATADLDLDGDLDLIVVNGKTRQISRFTNEGGNTYEWVDVLARAIGDDPQFPYNRVNMHTIGGILQVRIGTEIQSILIDSPRTHVGLGQHKSIDSIRVIWTDGVPQHVNTPQYLRSRIAVLAPQILKGSCPYIYTWTGERFEFFSDCLWAAPLGLVQATGDLAPTREWEYLLIPGQQLAPRDGRYVLQFTEELWEAAYLDDVKLVAVDHPSDVTIFTNEKVGSPQMAAHRIHTVREPKLPVAVKDSRGSDLLPGLTSQDGDYVKAFQQRVMQGLVDPWFMEFELDQLRDPSNVRLVLIGWVFPTDTSLNLNIEQNPLIDPPRPPSIEVLNGETWETAIPFIGFPSGKTKAMVVDISPVTSQGHRRFRISSSMELYWDAAFVIDGEQDQPTVVQDCPLVASDLHYRGYSRRVYSDKALFRNGLAPEGYDYNAVVTSPRWAPMRGRFTRYGVVTDLLKEQDDQMVVMGSGDELTLEFTVPEAPVPVGWTRDFVLYNVGWDKDADLNTVYGQSSEPYPFKAMTRYPFAESDAVPNSPEYQRYLEEYQNREYPLDLLWKSGPDLRLAQ